MMRRSSSGGDSCTEDLVEIVAEKTGIDPTALPPLYDVIDPEQLDRIVETAAVPVCIEFRYCEYDVTIDGDGNVAVADPPAADPATEP